MGSVLLVFLVGLIILLISVDAFVKISSKMWLALKISPLIIGTTIVAVGTSLSELVVSAIALVKKDYGLATGNIIGSNIINVFLVLGIGVLLGNINIGTNKTQRNASLLALTTFLYLFLPLAFPFPKITGFILLFLAVIFSWFEVRLGIVGRDHEDKTFVNGKESYKFKAKIFWPLLLSLFGVAGGGFLTVTSIEKISLLSGYSTTFLGLSLAAMATSLPELLTTIFSRKKDQGKIAMGNIIGSNIYNLLLVGGIINLFSPPKAIDGTSLVFFIAATICLVGLVFYYAGKKVPKKIGVFLLLLFVIYLFSL